MGRIKNCFKGVARKWWGVATVVGISLYASYYFLSVEIPYNLGQTFRGGDVLHYDAILFFGVVVFLITLITVSVIAVILKYIILSLVFIYRKLI